MSGIAGIVNLDGAPVDRALLNRMAAFLGYRGPDRAGIWSEGPAGLVHTLFATTEEAKGEQQPLSFDGQTWITADARIDGRADLIRDLVAHGCQCSVRSTDPELILHGYSVWGEQCVEHLLGDFAFAIWDGAKRKLFCARDHFGVRPFFYARLPGAFLFGNSMDVPLLHPECPDEFYEQAIGEYLVLGSNSDLQRTVREAIWRLPPSHALVVSGKNVKVHRYWSLPVDPPTVFRRSRDYVDRFLELFEQAVADRLRTDRAAVLMSGGMDSSSIAAMAKQSSTEGATPCAISAHTQTYRRLIPYEEGRLAKFAAAEIGVPWNEFPLDDAHLLGWRDRPEFRRSEPWNSPLLTWTQAESLGNPLPGRVVLTGQGGDGIFSSLRMRHCRDRIRDGQWPLLTAELARYLLSEGRLRRLQLGGYLRAWFGAPVAPDPFPEWIDPDLARRCNLRQRYAQCSAAPAWPAESKRAVRPEAHGLMKDAMWPRLFEEYDADNFGGCMEARHPFFDLRLVRYVLSLPALPWCSDKELLRRSMRGLLPNRIRLRRKQPVFADMLLAHFQNSPKIWLEDFDAPKELAQYVDAGRAIESIKTVPTRGLALHLRPINLGYWLKSESKFAYNLRKEECCVPSIQGAV
jgi:asparagine synthase (glutamine-hydrolysing)